MRPHKRMLYDQKTNETLNHWYLQHESNPYATKDQKIELAKLTSLTVKQVTNWLINARMAKKNNNGIYNRKIKS